ncbi:1,6-anhydro-N-acetylmuramyl-L-alanine amidase AmpD [Thalassocella blandensis]|nr:1,6-anhydro-N-acetylmuramyl-L-alanine amidase AmpD [Thalassocella blandensis]
MIKNGRYLLAKQVNSPNFNARPQALDISLLVIHNISLPPGQFGGGYIERFFQNQLPENDHPYFKEIASMQVSAHFLIDRAGSVTQFVDMNERAWHAGLSSFEGRDNCNDFAIGIELEGTDHTDFTDHQYQALSALTQHIISTYPAINLDRIVGHSDIAPGRKTDPGPHFDWARYRKELKRAKNWENSPNTYTKS